MKLSTNHREALLDALEETHSERAHTSYLIDNTNDDQLIIESFEIDLFLARKRIDLIRRSLIVDDIDF